MNLWLDEMWPQPYCLWLQVTQIRQCGNYLPMRALHNCLRPMRNPDLLPPVTVLHICKCIWTMREFMRICCEMFLQNRSAGIIHNSTGGESLGVPWSRPVIPGCIYTSHSDNIFRYQIWTLWRNRVAQDIIYKCVLSSFF